MNFVPGKRILKTFAAVFICLLFFQLIDYKSPIYATIACILMMKENADKTKQMGIYRTVGTIIGGAISYLSLSLLHNMDYDILTYFEPVIVSLAVLLALILCKGFKLDSYVSSMSAVVIVVTMLTFSSQQAGALTYVVVRTKETIVGIVVAYLVNEYFFEKAHF